MSSIDIKALMLVLLSAFLFSFAFFYPDAGSGIVFFFLVPLFSLATFYPLSFWHGFLWGFASYAFLTHDFLHFILLKGGGNVRFLAILCILIYCGVLSGTWFYCAQRLSAVFNNKKFIPLFWPAITFLFFSFFDKAFFLVIGLWQGVQLYHPVLPLATRPQLLFLLPYLGKEGYLVLLIACNLFIALTFTYKQWLLSFALLLFFFFLPYCIPKPSVFLKKSSIGSLILHPSSHDPQERIESLLIFLDDFHKKYPQITTIITPESTFPFPFNTHLNFLRACKNEQGIETLILGSHRKEGEYLYNTLYHIHKGAIVDFYDKANLVPFTEYVPSYFPTCLSAKDLFFSQTTPFCASRTGHKEITISEIGSVTPLICSDLFFLKPGILKNKKLLCIVNDAWFRSEYIPYLMYLHAKIVAMLSRSRIFYVSYRHSCIIESWGQEILIPTLECTP